MYAICAELMDNAISATWSRNRKEKPMIKVDLIDSPDDAEVTLIVEDNGAQRLK